MRLRGLLAFVRVALLGFRGALSFVCKRLRGVI